MSNVDKVKPEIILNLDRPRKFLLNLKGLRIVEEQTGKSLFKQIKWKDLGFSDLSLIVWAGLLADDDTLTRDQTDAMFDMHNVVENFKELIAFAEAAIDRAMPTLSEDEAKALSAQKKKLRKAVGTVTAMTKET